MNLAKQTETPINENIILISQEVIHFFFNKLNEVSNLNKNDDPETLNEIVNLNENDVSNISKEIEEFILRKIDSLKKNKKYYGTDVLKLLHFALVSLIDEMLITSTWPGKEIWKNLTLENRIFSSSSSGDLFYDYCDRILLDRDYKYRELAMCFYLCLCSGFKGKYHSNNDNDNVEQIKTNLYQFYNETNFETEPELTGVLPSISYESSNIEFEINHKKIMYSLLLTNLFLFTIFLATSIYIWLINNNILSKGIM